MPNSTVNWWADVIANQPAIHEKYEKRGLMILLNIGCGPDKLPNVINLDINSEVNPDIIHDLEVTPLPFEDNSIHGVYASHIFEHIVNLPALIKDLKRIIMPGGVLDIHVPFYLSEDAWSDPTHVRAFSSLSFLPAFWEGWKIDEVSLIDAIQLYSNYPLRHICAKMIKLDETEGVDDGATEEGIGTTGGTPTSIKETNSKSDGERCITSLTGMGNVHSLSRSNF